MKSPWRIEMIPLQNGERYPLLVNCEDSLPLYKPTVYATSMVRNSGKAESTTSSCLRAIMFLYLWARLNLIDIDQRFRRGEFLKLSEIESLCTDIKLRYDRLYDDIGEQSKQIKRRRKRINFKHLMKVDGSYCQVHSATTRLRYIRDYLDWLAGLRLARVSGESDEYSTLHLARQTMNNEINARIPSDKGVVRDPIFERLGLTHEAEKALIDALTPNSPRNPFKQMHTKVRNQLIILLMLHTGVRRGEALGLRITEGDLDLQKNTVTIHRMPIDPQDSRLHKPQTKTRPRILPIETQIARLAREYITKFRRKYPKAAKHPFLFVESKSGNPLSIAALEDVFNKLRETIPELPTNFSAHFTRYTWNDRFSEYADEKIRKRQWTEADENNARCLQMGWSETSPMAALYAKRHNKKKADEFSLKRQEQLIRQDAEAPNDIL